jgi:outer membrane protein OmpA-like peptidoglycan-associated protein
MYYIKSKLTILLTLSVALTIGQSRNDFLKLGDKEYKKGNYYAASEFYLRVFDTYNDSSIVSYPYARYTSLNSTKYLNEYYGVMKKLADSYRMYYDYPNAEKWYGKLNVIAPNQFPDVRLWYGVSLARNQKTDEGIEQLKLFKETYNNKDELSKIADKELANAEYYKEASSEPLDIEVLPIDTVSINGRSSNFGANIYNNDYSLVFTSSRNVTAANSDLQNLQPQEITPEVLTNTSPSKPSILEEIELEPISQGDSIVFNPDSSSMSKKEYKKLLKENKKKAKEEEKATEDQDGKKDKKKKKKKGDEEVDVNSLPELNTIDGAAGNDSLAVMPPKKNLEESTTTTSSNTKVQLAPTDLISNVEANDKKLRRQKRKEQKEAEKKAEEANPALANKNKKRKPFAPKLYEEEDRINKLYSTYRDEYKQWTVPQAFEFEQNPDEKRVVEEENINYGTPTFNEDRTMMYFTKWTSVNQKKDYYEIYRSARYESGLWSYPVKLKDPINRKAYKYMHPSLTADGKKLFFVSDMAGGQGKLDIWYCTVDSIGNLSEPINLGPTINTAEDDVTPHINTAMNSLFYSSNGLLGMGGLDVYRAYMNPDGSFNKPENLGYPFNSTREDAYFVVAKEDTAHGYISSDRYSDCCYEILEFDFVFGFVRGRVIDGETQLPLARVPVRLINETAGGIEVDSKLTDNDGYYRFRIRPNRTYKVLAGGDGQLKDSRRVNTNGLKKGQVITLPTMALNKLILNKGIEIKNIYYDFGKATLRKESEVVLDTLANFLKENTNVVVEIGSHTDNIGTEEYNLDLSNRRSETVVNYLIFRGIRADLLRFKGYGESQPIAANQNADGSDNEAGRQLNRRTEFKVLEVLP